MKNTKRRGTLKLLKPLYNKIESLQTNILKVSEFEFTEQLFIFLENIPIYIASNTQYRSDISTLIQSALSTLDASLQLYIEQYSKNLNSTRLIDAFLNLSKSLKFILDNSLDQNYFTKIISLIEIFIKELEVFLDDYLIRSYSKLQSASTTSLKSLSIKVKKLFRQQESLPVRQSVSLPTLPRITKEPALFSRKSLALLFRKIDYTIPLKLDIDSNRDSIESKKRWSLFTDITESKKRNTINQETIQISPIAELIPLQNQNVLFTREKLTYTLNGIAYLVIGINASRNCIVSATLHQLFVSLFNGYDQDEMFLDAVISCHKFYSSTLEFLSKIEWFFEPANIACIWNTSEPRQIQLKVCNFLERWIKLQYQDFIYLDAAMKLDKIVYEIKKLGLTNESARLSGLCEMMQTRIKTIKELKSRDSFKEILEVSSKSSCDPFHSILGLCANKSSVLLDISTIDIARYFTAGDFRLFCHLNIHLLINDIPEDVEFSRILSRRFNTIRNWVALEICSSKANVRVKLVSKFIAIAQVFIYNCRSVLNFQTFHLPFLLFRH